MTKPMALMDIACALCATILLTSELGAQDANAPAIHEEVKHVAPQLRVPKPAKKSHLKAQLRAGSTPSAEQVPPPAPPTPAAPPQVAAAQGNEVQNFQGWTVTCFPPPADKSARTCIAKASILKSNKDRRPILFISIIKTGGQATLAVQTPTGIDLRPGVTMQIAKAAPRHLNYESCEPNLCTALVPVDEALMQELGSSPSAVVSYVGLGVGAVRVEYALQDARTAIAFLGTK